jgi:hypothetical protein
MIVALAGQEAAVPRQERPRRRPRGYRPGGEPDGRPIEPPRHPVADTRRAADLVERIGRVLGEPRN